MADASARAGASQPELVRLAPKMLETQSALQYSGQPSKVASNSFNSVRRCAKTSTISTEEWETRKADIHELYVNRNLPLPEVMKIMKQDRSFIQS